MYLLTSFIQEFKYSQPLDKILESMLNSWPQYAPGAVSHQVTQDLYKKNAC